MSDLIPYIGAALTIGSTIGGAYLLGSNKRRKVYERLEQDKKDCTAKFVDREVCHEAMKGIERQIASTEKVLTERIDGIKNILLNHRDRYDS